MRRSTIIGCLIGLLALTMNAQETKSSTTKSNTTTVEMQKKPTASMQELLARYSNMGSQIGSISDYFTKEEQQMLHSYFNNQKPANSNQVVKGVSNKNSAKPISAADFNGGANRTYTPLFVAPSNKNSSEDLGGNLAPKAMQYIYSNPFIYGSRDSGLENKQQTASLEELLVRLQAGGNQTMLDLQQFTLAEREVLSAYFRTQNNNNRSPQATLLTEGFDDITTLPGAGYSFVNVSDIVGLTNWFQGNNTVFPAQSGGATSYIGANYNSTAGSVINNFMITPVLNLENGDEIKFWTRSPTGSTFPDRLEVRLDPTGANTNPTGPTSVGSYTELLLEINPTLTIGGYPGVWTEFTATVSGLTGAVNTRVAFRYWVTNGGPSGSNSDYIGIDTLTIEEGTGGGGGGGCTAGVYTTRAAFDTETGPINLEDFAGGPSTIQQCGLVISNTGESCFPAGEILPGIEITANNSAGGQTVYVDPADGFGNSVPIVGSNTFVDYTIINFPNNDVNSFGFDLITLLGTGPVQVRIFGTGGLIDTQTVTSTNPESFWGYIATETIVRVELEDLTGVNIEGIGMLAFGQCSGGGGGGSACSQANPGNAFENAFFSSTGPTAPAQVISADITVPAGTDFSFENIAANIWTTGGQTVVSADIIVYNDNAGLPDTGSIVSTQLGVVPTSQTSLGSAFGFDIYNESFDLAPVALAGQAGVATTYWVSIYLTVTTGAEGLWEATSVSIAGNQGAFSLDNGATWNTIGGYDLVYTFSGQCTPIGGGGGVLDTAYGINNSNLELIGFPVSDPSTVEVFGSSPVTVNFENAGAIDPANPTTGYVLDNLGAFYSFDVASGFYTSLGTISGEWLGMEYDQTSGILYAISLTNLYTIDPIGVSATLVGPLGLTGGALPIALAIDGAGVGYTYDLVDDNLYSINMATGATTLVGNIGFDANFGQGMCYDALTDTVYMAAFNNGSFAGEWRSVNTTTGASTLIGPIVTTAGITQVAWVSIGETLPPPACPEPTNLTVSNITSTTADLSWTAEPNASSGYIWYVFNQGANPITDPPVATGTTPAGTTTATATGLSGGFNYDFYVVADCTADGLSQLAGPINFATPPACGGKFYDTGGPGGDYQNNENVTTTIPPANSGDKVTVTFTAFNVEATWDALYVYDGPNASSPIISSGNPPTNSGFPAGGYYGTTNPGPFTSTHASGALTFVFMSDASVPKSGWEADVTCAPTPPPNDMIVNSIDVDEIGFPYTDPAVNMPAATTENGNPAGCDLTGANGVWYNFVPFGDGTANAMIVTPGGASSVTFYTAPSENATETDLTLVP
ncbi:MAG: choice-of-anchor J domain-containing protein, partial [Flavobacteriaceae bacterium]|nr:choice-of-anchor J domain-containing protein [Flavobacteriaceae bacterium]